MKKYAEILKNVALWLDEHHAYGWLWILIIAITMLGSIGVGYACNKTEARVTEMELSNDTIKGRLDRIEMKQDMMYDLLIRKLGD